MSITDEFSKLQDLNESGALTDAEFAEAKAKVLVDGTESVPEASDSGALHREVEQLKIQNEMIRLDQDWEKQRDNLMLVGKGGGRTIPSRERSGMATIIISIMGLLTLGLSAAVPHAGLLSFCGIGLIIMGIMAGISGASRADKYQKASDQYEQCRSELQAQLDK